MDFEGNLSAQNEEIESLQSIYLPEELQVSKNGDGNWTCVAYVKVDVPSNLTVRYTSNGQELFLKVNFLPALQVRFVFPPNYPSDSPPWVFIRCSWLSIKDIIRIYDKIRDLWGSNVGLPVLYTCLEYMKYELLSDLGILDVLNLDHLHSRERKFVKKMKYTSSHRKKTMPWKRRPVEAIAEMIKSYNREQEKETFNKTSHKCQICIEDKCGRVCMMFEPCGHVYCRLCLKNYFTVLVKDGHSCAVKCPSFKCDSEATQTQVRDLLPPELFEKYDNTLLNTTLDTLGDITYCPRSFCQYPVTWTPGERLAMCPHCSYAFCIYCRMGYHGVEPCKLNADERKKLVENYQSASSDGKSEMENRYGKKQLQTLVSNTLSEYWIKDNGKNCPKCNIVIEKSDGCNKMTCFRCGAFFCWLCGAYLDVKTPYLHYNDPKSTCNNKLFLMDEIDGDWEWEQWDGNDDSGSEDLEGEDVETEEESDD